MVGCVLMCFKGRQHAEEEEWIDVLVDIDETLVYSSIAEGSIKVPGFLVSYRLAHGAVEFLVALDRVPGIRIGFYSCGAKPRNVGLIKQVTLEIEKRGYKLKQMFEVFSVPDGMYGKKSLKGLRKGLNLDRAILVDDFGKNVQAGEERNLLKIYQSICFDSDKTEQLTDAQKVFKARLSNNLVRALGMILQAIELSKLSEGSTVVQGLYGLQWDADNKYLHESSNAEEVYWRDYEP